MCNNPASSRKTKTLPWQSKANHPLTEICEGVLRGWGTGTKGVFSRSSLKEDG